MGIQDVGRLSLGQWFATVAGWNRAHGGDQPKAPSDADFEAALAEAKANGL